MKIGILIPVYNRAKYLKECLWCLERLELPEGSQIMIVDDASTEAEAADLISKYIPHRNYENYGVKKSLIYGYNWLFGHGCTHVINFDSDTLIKPNAVTELIKHYIPGTLLTGFHCTTMGRHPIVEETETLYKKKSVGGINFICDKEAYEKYILGALQIEHGNWDHDSCRDGAYCLKSSVVQHIGLESSLGHHDNPDVSDDFKYWDLPDVTLLCIDSNKERIQEPLRKCTEQINFGHIAVLNPDIRSKEEYSRYCIYEMYKHIPTSHVLVFQHDGFVNNWKAWDNSWLQYDYIGAPWHYADGLNVGNGGFSLRSKRLMEILATDRTIHHLHPEDHHICRTYRRYLEAQYGIKFAPKEVAEKFAFEGYLQPDKVLKDQFGRHGANPRTVPENPINGQKLVFNQFLSLGDILFLVPMARALMQEGNTVLWPIDDSYLSIVKHFPDIHFVAKSAYNLPYEVRGRIQTPHGTLLPYRFASELKGRTLKDCMRSKYELYGHDYRLWRQLYWSRDCEAEQRLLAELNLPDKFQLVNAFYGHEGKLTVSVSPNPELPIVYMRQIPGITLIDWLCVVERASEIHMANSSLNYLIELMDLQIPVYLYKRGIWGEVDFTYTDYLWENSCFKFVK